MTSNFKIRPRHFAAISTIMITVGLIAIFFVVSGSKNDSSPRTVGEFEFEGSMTKIIQAGDCVMYATKFKDQPEPRFFFNCKQR